MLQALAGSGVVVDHRGMSVSDDLHTDETLMLLYVAGETSAFATLYGRHKDGIWRYLLRSSRNEALTAELSQDVWASVIKARDSYEPRARFSAWLYRVAHNRLVDHWRTERPQEELDVATEIAGPEHHTPAARATQAEQGNRLMQALRALSDEQREAFLLQAEGGLSLEEIASTQGVGRETVKSRLRYALAKLRGELADVWP